MSDTTEQDEDQMIDPVTGQIIDQKKLAEQLLAQAREQGVSRVGPVLRDSARWRSCARRVPLGRPSAGQRPMALDVRTIKEKR